MQILKGGETLQRCNFGNPGMILIKQKLLLSASTRITGVNYYSKFLCVGVTYSIKTVTLHQLNKILHIDGNKINTKCAVSEMCTNAQTNRR